MKKLVSLAILLSAVLLAVPDAQAEVVLGVKVGQSEIEISSFKDSESTAQFYGGYRFMKFVGFELEWSQLGQFQDTSGPTSTYEINRLDLFVVGVIPISRFEIYGKVGYGYWDGTRLTTGVNFGADGTEPAFGIGFAVKFAGILALRVEYEEFDVDTIDKLTMAAVGLDFRF